ncbi:hypothetical protein I302_105012 [Kwoniella bestiolae CBS 10118]|uniref:Uncharacterized protein n=1 Tax=Kwoniella bestiolae CBS 10118 TaxID=1296100 RepID=A0A1B9FR43_9TREE|nr:hypothetical protein I302_08915 [Kwoniella bestiolae CBS 10118]OCF21243.1 hypothetical protein I302_08915 [Kwoniella bestiolae CBS 10118]
MLYQSEFCASGRNCTTIQSGYSTANLSRTLSCPPQFSSAGTSPSAFDRPGKVCYDLSASPSHKGSQWSSGGSDTCTIYSDCSNSQGFDSPSYDVIEGIPIPIQGDPSKSWNHLRERAESCQERLKSLAGTAIFRDEDPELKQGRYGSIISTCLSDIDSQERRTTKATAELRARWNDWIKDVSEKDLTDPSVLRKKQSFNSVNSYIETIGSYDTKGFMEYVTDPSGRSSAEKEWVPRASLAKLCWTRDRMYGDIENDLTKVEGVLSRRGGIAEVLGPLRRLYSTEDHIRSYYNERPLHEDEPTVYQKVNPPDTRMIYAISLNPDDPTEVIEDLRGGEWRNITCEEYDRVHAFVDEVKADKAASGVVPCELRYPEA